MSASTPERTGRSIFIIVVSAALTVAATLATLTAIAPQVYSAGAFVSRYFSALSQDSIVEALHMPGVDIAESDYSRSGIPASTSRALLRPGLTTLVPHDVRILSDEPEARGNRTVTVAFELAGESRMQRFEVAPEPAVLGVLPAWRFVESPLQVLSVTVENGSLFSSDEMTFDARAASSDPPTSSHPTAHYLVLAPAVYSFHYDSELAVAAPVAATVQAGSANTVTITMLPTPTLVERVQDQLDTFLKECAEQPVLQPAGCPFGAVVDDRVTAPPTWSLVESPTVTLESGPDGFVMPSTPGIVHLSVEIQQLYDGVTTTLEEDIGFEVELLVRIWDDGSIAIQLR